MNLASHVLLLAAIVTAGSALAQDKSAPAAMAAASVTVTATVVTVDQARRIVSLKGE